MKCNVFSEYLQRGPDCLTIGGTNAFPPLGSQTQRLQGGKD